MRYPAVDQDLRLNKATGNVQRRIVSWEDVEANQLTAEIQKHEDELNARREEIVRQALQAASADLAPLEAALAESKSEYEAYSSLKGQEPSVEGESGLASVQADGDTGDTSTDPTIVNVNVIGNPADALY